VAAKREADRLAAIAGPELPVSDAEPVKAIVAALPETIEGRAKCRKVADLVGQPHVSAFLTGFLRKPRPIAVLCSGNTGLGKSSTASILAHKLGCAVAGEWSGYRIMGAGEQTAESVRQLGDSLHLTPMAGSGWKVWECEECEEMHPKAAAQWKCILGDLPPRTVIVFTSNNPGKLEQAFIDRCTHLQFSDTADATAIAAGQALADRIWQSELGHNHTPRVVDMPGIVINGRISYRRIKTAIAQFVELEQQS
jgi:hypothetical protein